MDVLQLSAGELALAFVVTWAVGLTPPLLIRFVFVKRPIDRKSALAVAGAFFLINFGVFTWAGAQAQPPTDANHTVWIIMACVSYVILYKGHPEKGRHLDQQRQSEQQSQCGE